MDGINKANSVEKKPLGVKLGTYKVTKIVTEVLLFCPSCGMPTVVETYKEEVKVVVECECGGVIPFSLNE